MSRSFGSSRVLHVVIASAAFALGGCGGRSPVYIDLPEDSGLSVPDGGGTTHRREAGAPSDDAGCLDCVNDSGVIISPPPGIDGGVILRDAGPRVDAVTTFDAVSPPVDATSPKDSSVPPHDTGTDGITVHDSGKDSGADARTDAITVIDASPPPFDAPGDAIFIVDAVSPPDGGIVLDAGSDGGPTTTTITCGASTCDSESQDCCLSFGGAATCAPIGGCTGGVTLSCSSSANCSDGEVCCVSLGGGGASGSCKTTCGGGGIGGGLQLCGSAADCPAGEACIKTPLGLSICRPSFGGGGPGGGGGGGGGAPGGGGIP